MIERNHGNEWEPNDMFDVDISLHLPSYSHRYNFLVHRNVTEQRNVKSIVPPPNQYINHPPRADTVAICSTLLSNSNPPGPPLSMAAHRCAACLFLDQARLGIGNSYSSASHIACDPQKSRSLDAVRFGPCVRLGLLRVCIGFGVWCVCVGTVALNGVVSRGGSYGYLERDMCALLRVGLFRSAVHIYIQYV
ncbi:hypothetical protein DE146DRAFT_122250 [Phaeosphaeria sp. MPI-PUGE-AT-0046c]|nr:hypothetical protein DE146DRAFT_122250 [Phaeosphaeria sp. MPI-PUGE-AT-0046c]